MGYEKFTKKYEEFGFEITVWFFEIREEYFVWKYTIKDEDGVRDPEKVREFFWSKKTRQLTLQHAADYICDYHSFQTS